jgi:hypothetical protein
MDEKGDLDRDEEGNWDRDEEGNSDTLQRQNAENLKKNIPRKGISGPQSQFPHSFVCERIIFSDDGSAFSAGGNMWTDPGNILIAHRHMNVEIGA